MLHLVIKRILSLDNGTFIMGIRQKWNDCKNLILFLIFALVIAPFMTCDQPTSTEKQELYGVFLGIADLNYQSSTQNKFEEGCRRFSYYEGDQITFYLGRMKIGTIPAKPKITLFDFVPETKDIYHPTLINMCRFLWQCSGSSSRGCGTLSIPLSIREKAMSYTDQVDFDQTINEFERKYSPMMSALAGSGYFMKIERAKEILNCHASLDENDDYDRDNFSEREGDCNDLDPLINPDAPELLGDEIDNNCNSKIDEPRDEIIQSVCSGNGWQKASDYDSLKQGIHPILVPASNFINFKDALPPAWIPNETSIELLVCYENDEFNCIQLCHYKDPNSSRTAEINRIRHSIIVSVYIAKTGTKIKEKKFYGGKPSPCPATTTGSRTITGSKVKPETIIEWLKQFVEI